MEKKKAGRKKKDPKDVYRGYHFSLPPIAANKIDKVKTVKSAFIAHLLASVPDDVIKAYNRSPKKLLSSELDISVAYLSRSPRP